MKQAIPVPVIIGVIGVVVAIVALFFVKGAMAQPQTPHPDRSKMMGPAKPATAPTTP